MRTLLVAILVACAGCGTGAMDDSTAPPTADPLIGTWTSPTGACELITVFGTDSRFGYNLACGTATDVQLEHVEGVFSDSAGVLNLTADAASCTMWPKTGTVSYTVAGDTMTWKSSTGATVFARQAPATGSSSTAGGHVTYGCFASTGVFTAEPLAKL